MSERKNGRGRIIEVLERVAEICIIEAFGFEKAAVGDIANANVDPELLGLLSRGGRTFEADDFASVLDGCQKLAAATANLEQSRKARAKSMAVVAKAVGERR